MSSGLAGLSHGERGMWTHGVSGMTGSQGASGSGAHCLWPPPLPKHVGGLVPSGEGLRAPGLLR